MTYREAVGRAEELFLKAGIKEARTDSRLLMEFVCDMDRSFYLLHADDEISADKAGRYLDLAAERSRHIPLQHLTGMQEFMGLTFLVDAQTMIPRQDTEILAEEAVRILSDGDCVKVLDLCTGSGVLAVSIKSFCPDVDMVASDISEKALALAAKNASLNNTHIEWIVSDLFSQVADRFYMILSNPPYIPTKEISHLMPEVRDHDPYLALDGGEDGLDFYRRILAGCRDHLLPEGYLLLEIGSEQGSVVCKMLEENGFEKIRVISDLNGLDRVVEGRRNSNV